MRYRGVARMMGGIIAATLVCIGGATADTWLDRDAIVSASDCDSASAEALPEYEASGDCPREADPINISQIDACLAMGRNALELLDRAEGVCSGSVLPSIERATSDLVEQISLMEELQKYNRGEIVAQEMRKFMLKHERRHRYYRKHSVSPE